LQEERLIGEVVSAMTIHIDKEIGSRDLLGLFLRTWEGIKN